MDFFQQNQTSHRNNIFASGLSSGPGNHVALGAA